MQGVEILNTIYEYDSLISPEWFWGFAALALIISIVGMCTMQKDTIQNICTFLAVVVVLGMIVCGIGMEIKTDEVISTQYKVIISDEVSLTEFYEHYEVVDQDGKIFTVREKANETLD